MISVEEIQNICNSFPAVTEDIKWEEHLCFSVGKKIFIIIGFGKTVRASFKVDDDVFEVLSVQKGFRPAPHLGRYKWVQIDDITIFDHEQWKTTIKQSYELIKNKLSKKLRKELGIL